VKLAIILADPGYHPLGSWHLGTTLEYVIDYGLDSFLYICESLREYFNRLIQFF
jgi:hypothetical protein